MGIDVMLITVTAFLITRGTQPHRPSDRQKTGCFPATSRCWRLTELVTV